MSSTCPDLWRDTRKVFQDTIHGSVELHDLLVKIVDTTEFQRLRDIKQLSMTFYVYPSASHTRFEHCIGVCYLAGKMLQALHINSDLHIMKKITNQDKLCVLIAGLCHDIGHGPFSHTWEAFLGHAGKDTFKHEEMSEKIIDHMLKEYKLRDQFEKLGLGNHEIMIIKEMIAGKPKSASGNNKRLLPKEKWFLYSIISNEENSIDVDKWDYFLRDGQNLGIQVTFDYERLLKFTKVEVAEDGATYIAFRDKEKISLLDMFRMRADLHIRAYQHPVARKLEAMLLDALLSADEHFRLEINGKKVQLSTAHENVEHYLALRDSVINIIRYTQDEKLKISQSILERIDRRELYEQLGSWEIRVKPGEKSPTHIQFLRALRLNIKETFARNIFVCDININHGKYQDPLSRVRFYSKQKSEKPRRFPDISNEQQLPFQVIMAFSREPLGEDRQEIEDYLKKKLREAGVELKEDDADADPQME